MLNRRPTLLGAGFLYCILSATSQVPKLHRGSRGSFRPGVAFPYHIFVYNSVSNSTATGTRTQLQPTVLTSVLLSNILVQRPLDRPLDLWNRMFNRHQAEITVMQFRGHSLPVRQSMKVSWDFFSLSHFVSQFPPTRFPLLTAIGMCHFLPVHHLEMAFLAGSKGQNTTNLRGIFNTKFIILEEQKGNY